jgi:peptide deformylase
MAILKIARMGHPVLLAQAAPVPDPTTPDMRRLVRDMAETLRDAGGIGLAAPQVHESLRLFLWRDGETLRTLFNPTLTPLSEERALGWEGCLSIPGLRGKVPRVTRLAWRGLDENAEAVEGVAEGLGARVLQHENDHLDGLFYLMRMEDLSMLGFTEEMSRAGEAAR